MLRLGEKWSGICLTGLTGCSGPVLYKLHIYVHNIPYTYKFSSNVAFTEDRNPGFLQFYF